MLNRLVIPPETRFEERNIVVSGDVVVGSGTKLGFGLLGNKVIVGERCEINGDVIGEEVRLDAWADVRGAVSSKGDAYIGEFASISGKLTVFGDLEIGRNVRIKEGFEAKGLITIQDPLPVIIFIFFYLLELLRLGRLEEAEKLLSEAEELQTPLIIPENAVVTLERLEVNVDAEIMGSRVLGNLKCKNAVIESSEIFGSVRGKDILVDGSRIHGAVEGDNVYIINGSEVFGHIRANRVYMEEKCTVEGSILGKHGVWIKQSVDVNRGDLIGEEEEEGEEEIELTQNVEDVEEAEEAGKVVDSADTTDTAEIELVREENTGESGETVKTDETRTVKEDEENEEDDGMGQRKVQKDVSQPDAGA